MKYNWHTYCCIATAQLVDFRKTERPGVYVSREGVEINVVNLNTLYQWSPRGRVVGKRIAHKSSWYENANGFKVRMPKATK